MRAIWNDSLHRPTFMMFPSTSPTRVSTFERLQLLMPTLQQMALPSVFFALSDYVVKIMTTFRQVQSLRTYIDTLSLVMLTSLFLLTSLQCIVWGRQGHDILLLQKLKETFTRGQYQDVNFQALQARTPKNLKKIEQEKQFETEERRTTKRKNKENRTQGLHCSSLGQDCSLMVNSKIIRVSFDICSLFD